MAVRPGSLFYRAFLYVEPAIGKCPYGTVFGSTVPDGSPFYAVNKSAPKIGTVVGKPIACMGLINLLLRHSGKRVPTSGDIRWDGGTVAAWDYYVSSGYSEPFNLNTAKIIANRTGSGVLLLRRFRWANHDQGHAAVLLPEYRDGRNYVLQAIHGPAGSESGLNFGWTIEESHDGFYYEQMVRPGNWIDYDQTEDSL